MPSQRDQELTAVLMQEHQRFAVFLRGRTSSPEEANEILQQAFVKGLEKIDTVRNPERVVAWFYRLLRNQLIDHIRKQKTRRKRLDYSEDVDKVENEMLDKEIESVICRCVIGLLATLSQNDQMLLQAIDLEGKTIKEVAESLSVTTNTLRVRLHRARKTLAQKLKMMCGLCIVHSNSDCDCESIT